ncbi:MAG: VanZ family protein [Firmicutes bacterium]|uniref:VanZ family protein n=1 Tax=Candidatus Onthovivens merdipullorum TaxID=2840889 RepID=A0A9D9DJW1_9BACL|nr:VanZ family protein [Candidatus Onthovivens merdipullorum]
MSKKSLFYNIIKRGSLVCFFIASVIILVESGIDGKTSAAQSNSIGSVIQEGINENHDKETIVSIKDFEVNLLNPSENNVYYVGESLNFTFTYTPENTSYKEIKTEYDENYVSIVGNTIYFEKAGNTTIKFISEKDENLSKTLQISIKNVEIESLEFKEKEVTLNVDEVYTNEIEIKPANVTFKDLTYISTNPNVATIDDLGTVTAISPGETTIKAMPINNINNVEASYLVRVNKIEETVIKVIDFSFNDLDLYYKQNKDLEIIYKPINATINLSNLSASLSDNLLDYLSIKSVSVNTSKSVIKISFNYLKTIDEEINGNLSFIYNQDNKKFNYTININLLMKENLTLNDINKDTLVTNKTGNINYTTYGESSLAAISNTKYFDNISFNIPYLNSITSATYKYNLNNYKLDYDENCNVLFKITHSYNKINIVPVNKNVIENNIDTIYEIKYYPDTLDSENYILFTFKYAIIETHSVINDLKLTSFNENKINTLINDYEYNDIFSYTISTSPYNSSLANSGINIELIQNDKIIEFIYDVHGEINGLKTLKEGKAQIKITSSFLNENNLENIEKKYDIEISNILNKKELLINDKSYINEDIPTNFTINKNETIVFNYSLYSSFPLGNADYSKKYEDELIMEINDPNNTLIYNLENYSITGVKNGDINAQIKLYYKNNPSLSITLEIYVNYIEIDIDEFKFDFVLENAPNEYNNPINFDKVAIGTSFTIKPILNSDATNKEVGFISSDPSILEIDYNSGQSYALKYGKVKVTMLSIANPNIKITKEINILNTSSPFEVDFELLNPLSYEKIFDEERNIEYFNVSLDYGISYKLSIKPLYKSSSNSIIFTHHNPLNRSENKEIINVDNYGNIVTKGIGEDWIKISYGNNDSINTYVSYLHINVKRNTRFTFAELALIVRKSIGHFGLFAVTALALVIFLLIEFKKDWIKMLSLVLSLIPGFLLAFLSELIQYFTPGRGPSWTDVGIDFAGYAFTVIIVLLVWFIIYIVKLIIKKNKERKNIANKENN